MFCTQGNETELIESIKMDNYICCNMALSASVQNGAATSD